MIVVKNDPSPLETLKRLFGNTSNGLMLFDSSSGAPDLWKSLDEPCLFGAMKFESFLCKWEFFREAEIWETDLSTSTVRQNILTLSVGHLDSDKNLYGWIICADAGDAFKKMEKLGYLAGDMANFH